MTFPFIAIVSGTRETDTPHLAEAVRYQLSRVPTGALVVHGACGWTMNGSHNESRLRGADRFAHLLACEFNLSVRPFPADWDGEGAAGGPLRSFRMIDWAIKNSLDRVLLAFPVPGGKGTQRAIDYADRKGVPVRRWFE